MNLPAGLYLQGGRYKIVRFISSGGFGCTYEAVHTSFNQKVAIKEFFMRDFCNRNEQTFEISVATHSKHEVVEKLKKKFIDEANILFKMQHPGIVRVFDTFEENGTAYYVMDYIEGYSLDKLVELQGPLPENEAIGYIRQVCDALHYVHSLNRLHLDIKPGNIMINKEGRAVLIDFGTSKHYDEASGQNTTTLMGAHTPGYAPLEQISQSFTAFEPTVDIYALGATLYKLLTGTTPPAATLLVTSKKPLSFPDSTSSATRQAITLAMKPDKEERPQSVDEFLMLLERKKVSTSISSHEKKVVVNPKDKTHLDNQEKNTSQKSKSPQSNRKWWIAISIILLLLCAGGAIYYLSTKNIEETEDAVEVAQEVTEEENSLVEAPAETPKESPEEVPEEVPKETVTDVRFEVSGPKQVAQGEQFQLGYTLYNASGKDFRRPEFPAGCRCLYEAESSGVKMSTKNGVTTRHTTKSYFITVKAEKEGNYTIPPAFVVDENGNIYQTSSWKLEVLPPDKSPETRTNDTRAFARLELSSTQTNKHEPIVATLKLYTRAEPNALPRTIFPSFEGFKVQEIVMSQGPSFGQENYNGENFYVGTIKMWSLFPQRDGKIEIEPGEMDVDLIIYEKVPDPFGGYSHVPQTVTRTVTIPGATVTVLPSPW